MIWIYDTFGGEKALLTGNPKRRRLLEIHKQKWKIILELILKQ
jgi:hypothetical protein